MAEPIHLEDLPSALELGEHEMVAMIGGGGKTTIMHALGRLLPGTRVLTTTTKMGSDQKGDLPILVGDSIDGDPALLALLAEHGCVLTWGSTDRHKAVGVSPDTCNRWFGLVDHVLIEADGARKRPFKAPNDYEPVVPSETTVLVSVIGSDALNQPIDPTCHRPHLVADLARCSTDDDLTPERASAVLLNAKGGLKEMPDGCRAVVVITKVSPVREAAAAELAGHLEPHIDVIVVRDTRSG